MTPGSTPASGDLSSPRKGLLQAGGVGIATTVRRRPRSLGFQTRCGLSPHYWETGLGVSTSGRLEKDAGDLEI